MSQQGHRTAMMSHMSICALYARQMTTLAHHCQLVVREKTRRGGIWNGMVYVTFVALLSLTVIAFTQSVNVQVPNPGSLLVMAVLASLPSSLCQ